MASAAKVDVTLQARVKPSVGVGVSTVTGGGVTLVAYALAIIAYFQGARDEATISALIIGTISLVTVLGGRYAQAVVALIRWPSSSQDAEKPVTAAPISPTTGGHGAGTQFISTYTTPGASGAYAKNIDPPAADDDEPGDPDALPDYSTSENMPPDEGDAHARPEATP